MGYYSKYNLSIPNQKVRDFEDIEAYLEIHKEESFADNILYFLRQGGVYSESTKWYENNEDMNKLSLIFPETLFQLDREGEESGDIERVYFQNGKYKSYQAKIVFDEYNENDMKEYK